MHLCLMSRRLLLPLSLASIVVFLGFISVPLVSINQYPITWTSENLSSALEHTRPFWRVQNDAACDTPTLSTDINSRPNKLGVASQIYLISLPRRQDRRGSMEILRLALEIEWTIIDAVPSDDRVIGDILERVSLQRKDFEKHVEIYGSDSAFRWPRDIDALAVSQEQLPYDQADLWTVSTSVSLQEVGASASRTNLMPVNIRLVNATNGRFTSMSKPQKTDFDLVTFGTSGPDSILTCATEDNTATPYILGLPEYLILSAPKIACWYSHVSAIRRFVDSPPRVRNLRNGHDGDIAIILEDDVDMERDVHRRLRGVWDHLPSGWDIVFLGHCWSNESSYPAITSTQLSESRCLSNTNALPTSPINLPEECAHPTFLHPSFAPKCTHAYALSRTGARRLLLHLRYPPFAYSRALDQAIAWLVESGRLRAYSLVPSVVVQRKMGRSDIMYSSYGGSGDGDGVVGEDRGFDGTGSKWKEGLFHGVFGT